MRIRMVEERHGGRYDGRQWPGVGGEWDVPDEEGRALCSSGAAVPVAVLDPKVEIRGESGGKTGPVSAPGRSRGTSVPDGPSA